jgi:SRSO17 transposase
MPLLLAGCYKDTTPPGWSRWLLARRALTRNSKGERELACYLCCAPAGTTDEELIWVAGSRWAVGECFQTAKTQTGLDHYQVRRYDASYWHITLAMLAHAYLSVTAEIAVEACSYRQIATPTAPAISTTAAALTATTRRLAPLGDWFAIVRVFPAPVAPRPPQAP